MTAMASYLKAGVAGRRGYAQVAAGHMRAALEQVDWDSRRHVMGIGNWKFYLDDSLEEFCSYVDTEHTRVITSTATWETLSYERAALDLFTSDMMEGASGMRFIVTDKGPYQRAAVTQANARGRSAIAGKDAITELKERAQLLLRQTASMNRHGTDEAGAQSNAVRYARLRNDYANLTEEMAVLGSLIGLVGDALLDATVS